MPLITIIKKDFFHDHLPKKKHSVNSAILDSETRQNQEYTTQMNRNQEESWKSPGSGSQQAHWVSIMAILKETTPHILMLTFWNIGSQIGMTFHFHGLLSNEETQQHFHFPKLKKKTLDPLKGEGILGIAVHWCRWI